MNLKPLYGTKLSGWKNERWLGVLAILSLALFITYKIFNTGLADMRYPIACIILLSFSMSCHLLYSIALTAGKNSLGLGLIWQASIAVFGAFYLGLGAIPDETTGITDTSFFGIAAIICAIVYMGAPMLAMSIEFKRQNPPTENTTTQS